MGMLHADILASPLMSCYFWRFWVALAVFTTKDALAMELNKWTADQIESESRVGLITVCMTLTVEGDGGCG